MSTTVVVGSGPNGLAAALTLAQQGVHVTILEAATAVGGGTRASELSPPGLLHDDCSAVHPMTVASPFIKWQRLENAGLRWCYPQIDMAHPFDDGSAAMSQTSIHATTRNTLSDLTDRNESWINRAFSLPAPQPESAEPQLSSSPARATTSEYMTSMKRD